MKRQELLTDSSFESAPRRRSNLTEIYLVLIIERLLRAKRPRNDGLFLFRFLYTQAHIHNKRHLLGAHGVFVFKGVFSGDRKFFVGFPEDLVVPYITHSFALPLSAFISKNAFQRILCHLSVREFYHNEDKKICRLIVAP